MTLPRAHPPRHLSNALRRRGSDCGSGILSNPRRVGFVEVPSLRQLSAQTARHDALGCVVAIHTTTDSLLLEKVLDALHGRVLASQEPREFGGRGFNGHVSSGQDPLFQQMPPEPANSGSPPAQTA
jgi:hypothetical protein